MKVICIKKCIDYSGDKPYWYSPDIDDVLDVIEAKVQFGRLWYDLAGYSEFLYDADYFKVLKDKPAEVIETQLPNYVQT